MHIAEPRPVGTPAGWYPDSERVHFLKVNRRYWDGEQWTDQRSERWSLGCLTGLALDRPFWPLSC